MLTVLLVLLVLLQALTLAAVLGVRRLALSALGGLIKARQDRRAEPWRDADGAPVADDDPAVVYRYAD